MPTTCSSQANAALKTNSTSTTESLIALFSRLMKHLPDLTVFQLLLFAKLYTQIQELHIKGKMTHISCKMKHCIQNITNTSQKQTFANTFSIKLINVRFVCVELCCVLHKVFCEITNRVKGWELVSGFADVVCASAISEIVWQVKILCVNSWKITVFEHNLIMRNWPDRFMCSTGENLRSEM